MSQPVLTSEILTLPTDAILAAARARKPDFIVKREDGDYLRRWWIIPRNGHFNMYLHQFVQDDDDRALHDHPWHSASLILSGGYRELLPNGLEVIRNPGDLVYREPDHAHRVILHRDRSGRPIEAWTLFITGPRVREWGFHCANRWVPWEEFTAANDPGAVGKGCGE